MVILDGGMSRELARLGAELRQPEWSALALMEQPAIVEQVHRAFIEAGADVVTTNSYALVPFHIGEQRFEAEGLALAQRAGALARQAADAAGRPVQVAGSLPPIFGSYEPDRFASDRVQHYLGVLVAALEPFVDVWLGETLSLVAEAEAVRVATHRSRKPVWISFTLDDRAPSQDQVSLRSGETVETAARWAAVSGVEALLFNCSQPEVMERAVREAASVFSAEGATIPIGVYANAFETKAAPEPANAGLSGIRLELTPATYAGFACNWAEAGATLIGGCCGVGASHIHTLAQALERRA